MQQPYFTTTIGTVMKMLPGAELPKSGAAMFKFSDPKTLERLYSEAGFVEIDSRVLALPWTWPGTAEDVWAYFQDVTVPFKALLDSIPLERRDEISRAVVAEISRLSDGEKIHFGAEMVLASSIVPR